MNYYSQHGEDRLLSRLFRTPGVCVEVGANDGLTFSNTKHFEDCGWDCVLVEPTPELCSVIRQTRSARLFECAASDDDGDVRFFIASGHDLYSSVETRSTMSVSIQDMEISLSEITVKARKLDHMLAESGIRGIDFITIDVEGHEMSVLRGFSLDKWMPQILVIEDSTDINETEVSRYLKKQRYLRFYRSGGNDWYMRKSSNMSLVVLREVLLLNLSFPGILKAWLPVFLRRPLILGLRYMKQFGTKK